MAKRQIELIKTAFDRWERRVTGSSSWDDVDDLMGAIFSVIKPESFHGEGGPLFGANRIWSGWGDLLNRSKMTRSGYGVVG